MPLVAWKSRAFVLNESSQWLLNLWVNPDFWLVSAKTIAFDAATKNLDEARVRKTRAKKVDCQDCCYKPNVQPRVVKDIL